jgi:hypothetical protein
VAAEVPRNGPFVLVTSDPEDMRQLVGEADGVRIFSV